MSAVDSLAFITVRQRRQRGLVTHGPLPATLSAALPNRRFHLQVDGRPIKELCFSVAVLAGEVVDVSKGLALAHLGRDEEGIRRVDFDDERAAERAVDVHVQAEWFIGREGEEPHRVGETLTFQWGGLGQLDRAERERYIASVATLGRVVVVLDSRRDGVLIPVLQGALLGLVDREGQLHFPGLGEDEPSFMGEIRTLDELRRAATAETPMQPWTGPLINGDHT